MLFRWGKRVSCDLSSRREFQDSPLAASVASLNVQLLPAGSLVLVMGICNVARLGSMLESQRRILIITFIPCPFDILLVFCWYFVDALLMFEKLIVEDGPEQSEQ